MEGADGRVHFKKNFDGKTVFVILKNKRFYTGKIIDEDDKSLLLLDKFNKNILIMKDSISLVEEQELKK